MNIVLGISGGIAAYKTPELVRRLRERGADVQIVMTASAEEFVTPTSLQAVSGRPIRSGAPDLLTTLCLATEAPIAIAPAMNRVMWANPAVQANRKTLEKRGMQILGPDHGSQACGETGAGRMLDPDVIADAVCSPEFAGASADGVLAGKTVLVTAGPTREPIDPVRYITNRSSGKMGYAIAAAAHALGARVILISGPVSLQEPRGADVVHVETAEEMHAATHERIADVDIFIAAAAVSDYRPSEASAQKIKKTKDTMTLELVRSPDILASVAALDDAPFTVGFAAETENVREYALGKLVNKNLDMIVANRVGADCGFDYDDNAAEVLWSGGEKAFDKMPKSELAAGLMDLIAARFFATRGAETQPALSIVSIKE